MRIRMSYDRKDALSLTAAVSFMAPRVALRVGWLVVGRVMDAGCSRPDAFMQILLLVSWTDGFSGRVGFVGS